MMKYKYQILTVLLIILVVSSPLLLFYYRTKHIIIIEAGEEAKNIATSIATFLEQDIERYKALNNLAEKEKNFDHLYYQEMLSVFQELKSKTGADFIFTEKFVSEDTIAYILDSEPANSEAFSPIGTLDGVSKPEVSAFLNGTPTATKLIHDPVWGTYITGFAPIKDTQNNDVIGLVGVDFSGDYIIATLQELNTALILLFSIIASALSISVVLFINRHMERLNQDFLTGLHNRRAFEETFKRMIKLFHSKKIKFTLLLIDIDKFKQINDTYGHGTGDLVLKRVANLICLNVTEKDFVFRYGGDEFVVILPDISKDQASFITKRLHDEFCHSGYSVNENQIIQISVSVGVAEYSSEFSLEQLLQEADKEMYRNKRAKQKITCL